MMTGLRAMSGAAAMLIAISPVAGALPASPLKGLEAGEWILRERDGDSERAELRRLCLTDLRQLIQLRHARHSCKRLTVDEASNRLSVSYDCGAAGGGRTDLRIETSRLVQIRSQGVAQGAPFSIMMEGRRLGACR